MTKLKSKLVKVFSPATIANVGPGFDVLGVAINEPGDIVIAKRVAELGLSFLLHPSHLDLPPDGSNVAAHVARLMINEFKLPFGIQMTLQKNMPTGSGLGSSGASCAAAAYAVNALLPKPLPKTALIEFAMEGERLATGAAHADNVAPSLLGGICLIRSYHPLDVIELPFKNTFYWVVVHPHLIIHTKTARDLLPKSITLASAIEQTGNIAALVTGISQGNPELIANSLKDCIAEPARAPLIPGFQIIKEAALKAGAVGFSISGSGPSVFALATTSATAKIVADTICKGFAEHAHVKSDIYISKINQQGSCIIGTSE